MNKTTIERYAISSLTTFLSTFFGTLALQLAAGHIAFTGAFLLSITMVAVRAGGKAVIESFTGSADQTI